MKKKIINIDEYRFRPRKSTGSTKAQLEELEKEGEAINAFEEEEMLKNVTRNVIDWHNKLKEPKAENKKWGEKQYLLDLGDEGQKFK